MKKITLITLCFISLLAFQNCSSVKVMDSWKSDDVTAIKENNFLVVARTDNEQARIAFENEIVDQMKKDGFKATASFSKFGSMKADAKQSESNKAALEQILKDEGFDGVVLTVLKDLQEETRVEETGGYYAGGTFNGYYPNYYGGFYGYYYHPMAYSTLGNFVEPTLTTRTSKVYVVETTVYDLKKSGEKQLVAVITSKLDNPQSAGSIAKDYVKKITASLE